MTTHAPASKLVPPKAEKPMPDKVAEALGLTDYASLTHLAMLLIKYICGVNPTDWLGEHAGGKWEPFAEFSDALQHVAEFYEEYGAALKDGSGQMLAKWSGNAADACGKYFDDFESAVHKQVGPLKSAADEVHAVAYGSWATQKAIGSAYEMLVDWIIGQSAEVAAADVFGPEAAYVAEQYMIIQGVNRWLEIVDKVGKMVAGVWAATGSLSGLFGSLHSLESHPLPRQAYDNRVI